MYIQCIHFGLWIWNSIVYIMYTNLNLYMMYTFCVLNIKPLFFSVLWYILFVYIVLDVYTFCIHSVQKINRNGPYIFCILFVYKIKQLVVSCLRLIIKEAMHDNGCHHFPALILWWVNQYYKLFISYYCRNGMKKMPNHCMVEKSALLLPENV